MLLTILLFILCFVVAVGAVPLIMRIVPPNKYYGYNTARTAANHEIWLVVNAFAGWALLAAAGLMTLALLFYSGTWWLKAWWSQILLFVILLGVAVGATWWFERRVR